MADILGRPNEHVELSSAFLIKSAFDLERLPSWLSYSFKSADWKLIERLRTGGSPSVERNLLEFAIAYIAANVPAVDRLISLEAAASASVIESTTDELRDRIAQLDDIDRQSSLTFKLAAALNSHAHSRIAEYFSEHRHSNWVRQRLLYPLMFSAINLPSPTSLADTLTRFFPWLESQLAESSAILQVLSPTSNRLEPLPVRLYIALLAHPYDALETLTFHFERELGLGRAIAGYEREAFDVLVATFPASRLARLSRLLPGGNLAVRGSLGRFEPGFPLRPDTRELLVGFFNVNSARPLSTQTTLQNAIVRLRWHRYPERLSFEAVTTLARKYAFLAAGRLLEVMLTSIYMIARTDEATEITNLLRQIEFSECVTPSVFTAPRGAKLLDSPYAQFMSIDVGEAVKLVDGSISMEAEDRTWIKAFHWKTRQYVDNLTLKEYLGAIRSEMPLFPNSRYLSGVDWAWLSKVIEATRIAPFRSSDGIYVLVLRATEERPRQQNDIRSALRPITSTMSSVAELVDYLDKEFGRYTLVFLRLVLTAEMILKMELENYYAAALAERLAALTGLSAKYGFDEELLTEQQFLLEQSAMSSALTLMNVNAAQFLVAWGTIRAQATEAAQDEFAAYEAVNKTFNEQPVLANFQRAAPVTFTNRARVSYVLKNRQWPAASIVFHVINTFLSHPSHGIESILAVRIRHDNLRYEFGLALETTKHSRIPGVSEVIQKDIVGVFEAVVTKTVEAWVDRYMHTPSPARPDAIFNFIPTQDEMEVFLSREDYSLGDLVEQVEQWLKERLQTSLDTARRLLTSGLKADLSQALQQARSATELAQYPPAAVRSVSAAMTTVVERRCDQLLEWFEMPPETAERDMTFAQMKLAVDGRFRFERERGKLVNRLLSSAQDQERIAPENVRLVFDIWCELVKNTLKYSHLPRAVLRVRGYRDGSEWGFWFKALRAPADDIGESMIDAEPSTSTTAAVFTSGKSGLFKVAHLAAAVAGSPLRIKVVKRRRWFLVKVPFQLSP